MDTIPALSKKLPPMWETALNLKDDLENEVFRYWESLYQQLDFLVEQEWIDAVETVIPGWEKIATQEDDLTAKHTMLVLVCCISLPEYQAASTQTQREIEWAALFHDIDKDTRFGRDASHGFRSAGVAAQGLIKLGFEFQSNRDFDAWIDLIMSSQKQVDGDWVSDFSHLADITSGLRYFFGDNSSAGRIIKAILFHQSLPTLDDWPNPVILRDDQIRAYLTLDDMEVLSPILLGDSDAWNLCEPTRNAYMAELRGNIEKVREILK